MDENIYHFSLGNSTDGPVGYCAAIEAPTPERALELLKLELEAVQNQVVVSDPREAKAVFFTGADYIQAYFNTDVITLADIDFWTDSDGNEHGPLIETWKQYECEEENPDTISTSTDS